MPQKFEVPQKRIAVLIILIVSLFIIYSINLARMQIVNFSEYQRRAKAVASRQAVILAQRGEIYDRNKDYPLVMNIPSFAIYVTPGELTEDEKIKLKINLNEYLGIDKRDLDIKIPDGNSGGFQPVELKDAIQYEQITYLAEHIEDFPDISWQSKAIRGYTETGSISHVIGYVGNITSEDLQVLYNKGYDRNSTIGKSGIEKQYDMILRGKDGTRMRMVDVKGRKMEEDFQLVPPENGNTLVLTIDRHIQELCEKALGERIGSVVVMRPSTGEVLAMVSYPFYNPNLFYTEQSKKEYNKLSLDPRFPFLNRAIQSGYAPASTFKVIMTTAVLEENAFPVDKLVTCTGSLTLGDRTFNCHKLSGHGPLNLAEGLAQSCNVFFYTMGIDYLGIDKIADYASRLGYGDYTGIDLPGESKGLVPTPEWKKEVYNTSWVGGDTMNVSIGQGAMNVTPIQMASAFSMIVNDGISYKPHILKEVLDQTTGEVLSKTEPEILKTSNISRETFETLKKYMRGVITDGTAKYVITTRAVEAAGKTGTGQMGLEEQWDSWFGAFAPYETDNPEEQIVLIINVEGVNEWEWWAPKAADMILQGIFANQTYEEVLDEFKNRWYIRDWRKRQQEQALETQQAESATGGNG